ncbi:hypothetical protein ACX80S_15715 [Arthrobacter sp. RHLT1-20]
MKSISVLRYAIPILLGAALFAAPQAATASPSTNKHTDKLSITVTGPPADQHFNLPAGLACPGFDLLVDLTNSRTSTKTFTTKDGVKVRSIEAGKGYIRTYTNMATGKKIIFPSKFFSADTTFDQNGLGTVTSTGHFGLIMFPTDVPAGPSTTEYVGRVVYTATPNNDFTILSVRAKAIDVCAKLA